RTAIAKRLRRLATSHFRLQHPIAVDCDKSRRRSLCPGERRTDVVCDAHIEQARTRAVGVASRTRSRVSAEQLAARRNRDQQPNLSGTVSICVLVGRRLREASKTETLP